MFNVQKDLPQINFKKDIQQNVNSIISGKHIFSPHLGRLLPTHWIYNSGIFIQQAWSSEKSEGNVWERKLWALGRVVLTPESLGNPLKVFEFNYLKDGG